MSCPPQRLTEEAIKYKPVNLGIAFGQKEESEVKQVEAVEVATEDWVEKLE